MSDSRWEIPVDVTALDPNDPGVAEEVGQRLASGDLQVAEGDETGEDPLRLKPSVITSRTRFWSGFSLVLLAMLAMAGYAHSQPWWWWSCIIVMFVIAVVVIIRYRAFSSGPSRRQANGELTRQVRLSQMAARNDVRYHVALIPGDSLYTQKMNPLRRDSILSALATNGLCEVGDDFFCGTTGRKRQQDEDDFPAQWGNLTLYTPPAPGRPLDEITVEFRGWYLMVAIPRMVPHIVVDAKADNRLAMDSLVNLASNQRVPMDDGFDSRFTVYAPEGYDADARDLFSSEVRQQLMSQADGVNIELVDDAVVFFSRGPIDWCQPDGWVKMAQLRSLVQSVMYTRIGEYVDTRAPKPRRKKGSDYQILDAKPRVQPVAAQGKVLKPSHGVNWMVLVAAVFGVALFFAILITLDSFPAINPLLAWLPMVGFAWAVSMSVIIGPNIRHRPKKDPTLR